MSPTEAAEVLGVAQGAADSDIQLAFRRKARTAHPDLGGTDAEFKRLGEAYRVLCGDPDGPSEGEMAQAALRDALNSALQQPSLAPLTTARVHLSSGHSAIRGAFSRMDAEAARLGAMRKRITKSGEGRNELHGLIDHTLRMIEADRLELQRKLDANLRAQEMLKEYSDSAEPPKTFVRDGFFKSLTI